MLRLSRGTDSLIVSPLNGASIIGWTRNGIHLLRPPSPDAVLRGDAGAMGCFPLVPYCNRVADRRFSWSGETYELAPNFGDHPHAIHGVGWQKPWQARDISDDAVSLTLHHDAAGGSARSWPFAFDAVLTYHLTDQGLTIRLEATNLHHANAPMGIGAHPYFPRVADATIVFDAQGVWVNNNSLPERHDPIPPNWNHSGGRSAGEEPLDNCFTGWHRAAGLPSLRIEADPAFPNLQVFTPSGAEFFCVEPVSHVPNAINCPDLPAGQTMAVLAPGETLGGTMTLSPR
jgi:aldose 1-epimerase